MLNKFLLPPLLGCMFVWQCIAQKTYNAFDVLQDKTVVPPNGILLGDTLFVDDSEVMNSNYLEYLHFLAQDSSDEALIKAYPDTTIFGSKHLKKLLAQKEQYYKRKGNDRIPVNTLLQDDSINEGTHGRHWFNYFSYHGTRHSPVVGVSYEQAVAYCKWRSGFVTDFFNKTLKDKNKYNMFEGKTIRFVFRLPTEKEWEAAAAANLDLNQYPYGQRDIYQKPHKKLKIQKHHNKADADRIRSFNNSDTVLIFNVFDRIHPVTKPIWHQAQPIFDNHPNDWGFYNMIGNVAEMVQEKGISKGGSYYNKLEDSKIKKNLPYHHPERWLGFRCVCQVIIEPKTGL